MKAIKKLALVCVALAAAAFGFVSCSSDDDSDYDDNAKLVVLARAPSTWNATEAQDKNGNKTSTYGEKNSLGNTISSSIVFNFNGTFTKTEITKTDDNNYTKIVTSGTYSGFPNLKQDLTFNVTSYKVTFVVAGKTTSEKEYGSPEAFLKEFYETLGTLSDYSITITGSFTNNVLYIKTVTTGKWTITGSTEPSDLADTNYELYSKQ